MIVSTIFSRFDSDASIVLAVSYNRPIFCPNATWDPYATTFPYWSIYNSYPYDIFITPDNTVYVVSQSLDRIITWAKGDPASQRTFSSSVSYPFSIFVTTAGDLYVSSGSSNSRVDRWTNNMTASVPVMTTCSACHDIFIDTNNNLFCSMTNRHQVVMRSLDQRANVNAIVAGTSIAGPRSDMLEYPVGIFVTIVGDLYVADCGNNRVQLFRSGELNATTLAGSGASGTISLSYPTGVMVDGSGYLFIVDQGNSRISGSGPDGFRCVAGCYVRGSYNYQLDTPRSMAFDSQGNIFVVDNYNRRIQKFQLATNACSKYRSVAL